MKKLFAILLVALMALTLVACGSTDTATTDDDTVVITVGTSPDYEPYESLDTDGNVVGFDPDMLEILAGYLTEEYGQTYKFELYQMNFDNIITQIQGNQVQIGVSGFSYDEERDESVDFSKPYLGSKQVVVVLADSDITDPDELKGAKIGAQTGTTGEQCAYELTDDVVSIQSVLDLMNGLAGTQYDAVIVDSGVANSYASSGNYKVLDKALLDEYNYIVVKEGDLETLEKIDFAIEKFIASDEYQALCEKYSLTPVEAE